MKDRKAPQTDEELVQKLADLFEGAGPEPPEEVDAALREFGYDPEALAVHMRAVAERAIAESPLNWRNRAPELAKERSLLGSFARPLGESREELARKIRDLTSRLGPARLQLAYRDLESLTDDDLASLLADLEFLSTSQRQPSRDPEG